MKFSIEQAAILKELAAGQSISEKKQTIPILGHTLLRAEGNGLKIVTTDLDLTLETEASTIECESEGAATVETKRLFELMKKVPEGEISFRLKDDRLIVSGAGFEYKLATCSPDSFPEIQRAKGEPFTLDASDLAVAIEATMYAITAEESRYALAGALLKIEGGNVRIVATDGHRLALAEFNGPEGTFTALIPKKAVNKLPELCKQAQAIEVSLDSNRISFRAGHRLLSSRLLAGQFPNYELVLLKGNDKLVRIEAELLAAALKRVGLLANKETGGVKFLIGRDRLKLSSQSPDVGEAEETIVIDYKGESVEIGFNGNHLAQFLDAAQADAIEFSFKDHQSPGLFRPATGPAAIQYVVMPMRLL